MLLYGTQNQRRVVETIDDARTILKEARLTEHQLYILEGVRRGDIDMKVAHLRETLGTGIFDAVTLDAAHNALLSGYGAVPDDWKLIAKQVSANTFKDRNASALSGFANLPEVPENAEYQIQDQLDEKVTYPVKKYGGLASISLEAQTSDEIGAFNTQVEKLAQAYKRTLNEFVLGTLFDNNPSTDYDSTALFHADHNNLNAGATVSLAGLQTGIAAMLEQTGRKGEQIYLQPWCLLVNPSKLVDAMRLVNSTSLISGESAASGENNPINALLPGGVKASPHIDAVAADSYIIADPAITPTVEVAFLNGKSEPDILREPETSGSGWSRDAINWKVRGVFGGDVVDHRGAQRNDAA